MDEVYHGRLIGGEELRRLVKIVFEAPKIKDDKVYIYPCKHTLRDEREIYEVEVLEKAFSSILNDFKEKASDVDRFVSIRIHISRTVWRQRVDTHVTSTDSGWPCSLRLDQLVKEFWNTERCNESEDNRVVLRPGDFVIFPSLEEIQLPPNVYGFLQTRTTVALKGLDVTPTNLIVPGFSGCLYLEVKNNSHVHIQIPDFFPVAELFLFSTAGTYLGAGPEYQKTVEFEPHARAELTPSEGMPEISLVRSVKAIAIYLMVMLPIMVTAYYLLSSFPSIPRDVLAQSLVGLFIVCSIGFVVISFGKNVVSFVTDKIKELKQ